MVDPISAGGLAISVADLARGQLKKRSWRRALVRTAVSRSGVAVSKRQLRRWLRSPAVWDLLVDGRPEARAAIADELLPFVPQHPSGASTTREADVLADALVDSLIRSVEPTSAVDVAHRREMESLAEIRAQQGDLLRQVRAQARDPSQLDRLPPSCLAPMVELDKVDPAIATAVLSAVLARGADSGELVREWIEAQPSWLSSAPFQAWLLLGALAQAFEEPAAASICLERAAQSGAPQSGRHLLESAVLARESGDDSRASALFDRAAASADPALIRGVAAAFADDADAVLSIEGLDQPFDDDGDAALAMGLRHWALVKLGDPDMVIAEAERLVFRFPTRGAPRLVLARAIAGRATARATQTRSSELRRAVSLAVEARDLHRTWAGPSASAVAFACSIALLEEDFGLVLQLALEPPRGEATPLEASDPSVAAEAAKASLMVGDVELRAALVEGLHNPFDRALIDASLATRAGDAPTAIARARDALAAASDAGERFAALHCLAALGEWPLPEIETLREENEEAAELILAASENARGLTDAAIARLRPHARTSPLAAETLANLYSERGQVEHAADTLLHAARVLGVAQAYVRATALLARAGLDTEASAAIDEALAADGVRPQLRWHLRKIRIEIAHRRAEWQVVEREARALIADGDPDPEAQWALAISLYSQARLEDSWHALEALRYLEVGDARRATMVVQLLSKFAPGADSVDAILGLADRFATSEEFVAAALTSIYTMRTDEDLSETTRTSLASATQQFVEQFPESSHFRQMAADDPEVLIEQLSTMLRDNADELTEMVRRAADGTMPIGMIATLRHRRYATALTHRAAGCYPIASTDRDAGAAELNAARAALDSRVAVDPSCLNLAALVEPIGALITSNFHEVLVADVAVRDAVLARDDADLRSTTNIRWDPEAGSLRLHEIDDETADRLAAQSATLASLALGFHQTAVHSLPEDVDLEGFGPWLGCVAVALEKECPVLADDLALRNLAEQLGVTTFGTVALLAALRELGRISPSEESRLLDDLLRCYCVDLPIDVTRLVRIGRETAWSPGPASYAVSRPQFWTDARMALDAFRELRRTVATEATDQLPNWLYAAAMGVCTGRSPADGLAALVTLTVACLAETSSVSESAPGLVAAAKEVAHQLSLDNPVPLLTREMLEAIGSVTDPQFAAQATISALSSLPVDDRQLVMATVLSVRGDV